MFPVPKQEKNFVLSRSWKEYLWDGSPMYVDVFELFVWCVLKSGRHRKYFRFFSSFFSFCIQWMFQYTSLHKSTMRCLINKKRTIFSEIFQISQVGSYLKKKTLSARHPKNCMWSRHTTVIDDRHSSKDAHIKRVTFCQPSHRSSVEMFKQIKMFKSVIVFLWLFYLN